MERRSRSTEVVFPPSHKEMNLFAWGSGTTPADSHSMIFKLSPVSARLKSDEVEEHIEAAYRVPLEDRCAPILLDYTPMYTSFLKKRRKPKKVEAEKGGGEEADPSHEAAGTSRKRKRVTETEGAHIEIREPREVDFVEAIDMADDLGDLPNLMDFQKSGKKKAVPSTVSKRTVLTSGGSKTSEQQKKLKLTQASGAGTIVLKDKSKRSPEKTPAEKTVAHFLPDPSSAVPYVVAPKFFSGEPLLSTDSVRANPKVALPLLHAVCLPEDMKKASDTLEGAVVEAFASMALTCQNMVNFQNKVVGIHDSVASLKKSYESEKERREMVELNVKAKSIELKSARKKLEELERVKKELEELKGRHAEDLEGARKAGFAEGKKKVIEYYSRQVSTISDAGYVKGAKVYYKKGIVRGYGLGLDAGNVPIDSDLRTVPEVESPEIDIIDDDEDQLEEHLADNTEKNTSPNAQQ